MNAESKPRQTSLRSFFGYLTLACVAMCLVRLPLPNSLFADVLGTLTMTSALAAGGAALGALFGRPGRGALFTLATPVLIFVVAAFVFAVAVNVSQH